MFYIRSNQKLPILATFAPNKGIKIQASAINQDLGNSFSKFIVEQKDPRFVYAIARAVTADVPNKNWDYFPLEEIKKSYQTFIGRNIFLDHNTSSVRNAVGKIIAAELREDEEGHTYVACLFKVDRQIHPDIAMKIENGIIDSVSMGANVSVAECSICSKKARREADFCTHLRNLGQYPDYEHGTMNYSINTGLDFTELSLVSVPADPMAKMHKVFNEKSNLTKTAEGPDQTMAESPNTPTQIAAEDIKLSPEEDNKRYVVDIPDVMKTGRPDADVPNQTTTVVEPVNVDTGFYQIDAASNEAADLLYNILEAHTNKGVEDIGLIGKTIKILFSPDVKDPERFVSDAVAVFGMAMGHGVVLPEQITASYKAYITKEAASNSEWVLRPEDQDFTSPLLGDVHVTVRPSGSTKKHSQKTLKITLSFTNDLEEDVFNNIKEALSVDFTQGGTVNKGKKGNTLVISYPLEYQAREAEFLDATDRANTVHSIVSKLRTFLDKSVDEMKQDVADIKDDQSKQIPQQELDLAFADLLDVDPGEDIKPALEKIYNDFSKQGGPKRGIDGLYALKSYLYADPERLAILNEFTDEKEAELEKEEPKAKAEDLPAAETEEVATKVVQQVAPAVQEAKEELPPQDAKEAIQEAKQQADNPVVEKAVDELSKGKPAQEVKQDLIELIDKQADTDAHAAVDAANKVTDQLEQAVNSLKSSQEAPEKKEEGEDQGKEPKNAPEAVKTSNPAYDDIDQALLQDLLWRGGGQRSSESTRKTIQDPKVGKFFKDLKQQGIKPYSPELDNKLKTMFAGQHPRLSVAIISQIKAIYASHYEDLDAYLDTCLGQGWDQSEPEEQAKDPNKETDKDETPRFATEHPIGEDNPFNDFAAWLTYAVDANDEVTVDDVAEKLAEVVRIVVRKSNDANTPEDILNNADLKNYLAHMLHTSKGWNREQAKANVEPVIQATLEKLHADQEGEEKKTNQGQTEEPAQDEQVGDLDEVLVKFKDYIDMDKSGNNGVLREDISSYGTLLGVLLSQNYGNTERNLAQEFVEKHKNDLLNILNQPGKEKQTQQKFDAFKAAAMKAYLPEEPKDDQSGTDNADTVNKEDIPEGAKVVDADGNGAGGEHYNTNATGSFEAGGWDFTLVGGNDEELEPIQVYVRRYKKIKDPDKGKVVDHISPLDAQNYEEVFQVKNVYRDEDIIKLYHIYRDGYRAAAFMAKDAPDTDLSMTYKATNVNPVYGGSPEEPAEYTMTFTRKAKADGYTYDVSGKDVQGLTGHAQTMVECLKQIFKAVYYNAHKVEDMTDEYKEGTSSVVFKYEPFNIDFNQLTDPNTPMETLVRDIHLIVSRPNQEDKDTVIAQYSIAKTMPNDSYTSPFGNKEASANYMLHITAEDTQSQPGSEDTVGPDTATEQASDGQGTEEGTEEQGKEQPKQEQNQTVNKGAEPVYHIAVNAVEGFAAIIPGEEVIEQDQHSILDYLSSDDGFRRYLLSWERKVRTKIYQYKQQQAAKNKAQEEKKNKKVDNVGESTQTPEEPAPDMHQAGFYFAGIKK